VLRSPWLPSANALITGISGQDGSYLAELLLERGYMVYGMIRRTSSDQVPERIAQLMDRIALIEGDLLDQGSILRVITAVGPSEVYNLAAMSHVHTSFGQPVVTTTSLGSASPGSSRRSASWIRPSASTRRARPRCSE
jgi:GDPmannose 4,6-dehydratase